MSPNILEGMSFRMSTRVTTTVVCCILTQILCVVSQKSFSFLYASSSHSGIRRFSFAFRFHFALGRGPMYCMSMSVCLSVRLRNSKTTLPNFAKFWACCLWPWIGLPLPALRYVIMLYIDLYSPICGSKKGKKYVLPVSWMTSCFYIMVPWRDMRIPLRW